MEDYSAGEFLQGFLEEAGEHLQQIHEHLLRLEQVAAPAAGASSSVDDAALAARADLLAELFRSFHTLKGLSSMVRLQDAATLSHALESALQAMQQGLLTIDQELLDRLFEGAATLDLLVNAVREREQGGSAGAKGPDIQPVLAALRAVTGLHGSEPLGAAKTVVANQEAEEPARSMTVEGMLPGLSVYPELLKALGDLEHQKVRSGLAAGQFFSAVVFASSAERAARGENVDQLRQQLQEVGTLIKAVPVMSGGVFRFLFLVASPQPLEEGLPLADEVIPMVSAVPVPAHIEPSAPQMAAAAPRGGAAVPRMGSGEGSYSPVVRVNLDRLDELMRLTGDLVRLRSRLGEDISRLDGIPTGQKRELTNTYQQIGLALRDLRRAVLHARMVPLSEAFNRMPLVVRDLARASQKDVRLTVQGENNEVDKLLVEKLLDPLIHLVRNAIIHGIEPAAERIAAGKPASGSLMLRGIPEGDHVLVELTDDGRGIDLQRVAARAEALGLREHGQPLSEEDALELISLPGFSTRERADLGAGRGMGLDIVMRMVRSFGGQMQMQTTPGKGTLFRLRLPLTLVIVDVLLVRAGQERYAAPRDSVERIIEIEPGRITHAESGEMLPVNLDGADSYYVLHRLSRLLGEPEPPQQGKLFGLVLPPNLGYGASGAIGRPVLVVDQVIDMREVVVQTFTDPLVARPGVAGASELGDGGLAIILDLPALMRLAHRQGAAPKPKVRS